MLDAGTQTTAEIGISATKDVNIENIVEFKESMIEKLQSRLIDIFNNAKKCDTSNKKCDDY